MDFLSAKWIWLYVGAFLMLAEILAPGFVVFFFGLAAATIGLLLFVLPSGFELSLSWQMALFSFFSILYLVTLRRYMKSVFSGDTDESSTFDSDVGRVAKVTETIRPEAPGRVILGDAEWSASAMERLEPGTEVKVVGRSNLTLKVERLV
jgi:membrane protein implicated in regulation of membrane protease activity